MRVPPGFLFRPTDEQLLVEYLERKSKDEKLPCDVVFERDIYGVGDKAPWQIFGDNDPWQENNTVFVITKLVKASNRRIARTAGCGSWHGETKPTRIFDGKGREIGSKKTLRFEIRANKSGVVNNDRWIMHEFSLSGSRKGEYVLCRIRRVPTKTGKTEDVAGQDTYDIPTRDTNVEKVIVPTKRARMEAPVPTKRARMEAPKEVVPCSTYSEMFFDENAAIQQLPIEQPPIFNVDFDFSGLPSTPFLEELLEVKNQENYPQMPSNMDIDLDELLFLLESEQGTCSGLDF